MKGASMATGNGNVWRTLGIGGMVIGLIGGTIGVASALGPAKDVERLEVVSNSNTATGITNERNIAVINYKLDVLISDVKDIKAAIK